MQHISFNLRTWLSFYVAVALLTCDFATYEMIQNANLMQQGNFIDVFLA